MIQEKVAVNSKCIYIRLKLTVDKGKFLPHSSPLSASYVVLEIENLISLYREGQVLFVSQGEIEYQIPTFSTRLSISISLFLRGGKSIDFDL